MTSNPVSDANLSAAAEYAAIEVADPLHAGSRT